MFKQTIVLCALGLLLASYTEAGTSGPKGLLKAQFDDDLDPFNFDDDDSTPVSKPVEKP